GRPRHPPGPGSSRYLGGPAHGHAAVVAEPGVAGKATIAIIGGTGALGAGLGRRLAGAGHSVLIGSRSAAKAEAAANTLAANATGMRPRGAGKAEAAQAAAHVFVTGALARHPA